MSTLRVHVVRARSLVAKDWSLLASRRRSDPYVVVVVDGIVVGKTAVAPKNLDPEWGEAFQVWVPGNGDADVELRIVDRDLVTDDESMGAVNFAVPRSGAAPFAWRPVAKTCVEIKSSTRLQCARMRPFRRKAFCRASRN
jgi:Ca2+-dependent lipid-binding protein